MRYRPASELPTFVGRDVLGELSTLGVSAENALLDPRSGRWGTLLLARPLFPGAGNELRWDDLAVTPPATDRDLQKVAWDAFVHHLEEHWSVLRVDIGELAHPGLVTVHAGGRLVQIKAPRVVDGRPVRDSYLSATIRHGNLTLLGARAWGDVTTSASPSLTAEAAILRAREVLAGEGLSALWRKSSLAFVPLARGVDPDKVPLAEGYSYRLVWVLRPEFPSDPIADWEVLVDAHSGELLALQDLTSYASTRAVVGGVFPGSNGEVTYPMPFIGLTNGGETFTADSGGNLLTCVDGDITTTLDGPFIDMIDSCGAASETTSGDVLDLGISSSSDCTVPPGASAGNTRASRTGFHVLNEAIAWARSYLPGNIWLQSQLPVMVNVPSNCGATGSPAGLSFFTSGGGCNNTAEIAGVLVHEWGHGLDGVDATPSRSNPGEGIADLYASLWDNTSCIGPDFRPGNPCGGYGDPCTQCTGVRDIDWARHASGVPHDIAWIDSCFAATTNGPCGGSVHCESAVYSEAVWDLWNRDLTAAPFSLSLDTARELTTRLTFLGSGAVDNWFNCVPGTGTGDGCNADGGYLNYLAVDDDDGDLTNGTPHMSAIHAAFGRHGIACATPAIQDSGCAGAPTTAPAVTVTPRDRGAILTWDPVAGADSYQVYRHHVGGGCGGGAKLQAVAAAPFFDQGLPNGMETCYYVVPVGAGESCVGPASSCTCVTPQAGPNLVMHTATSGAVRLITGDDDAFLDNCEVAAVAVGVENVGAEALSNVRVQGVRPVSHPEMIVVSPLPLTLAGNLPVCDMAQTEVTFQAAGLALGDVVEFEIDVISDQTSPQVETLNVRLAVPGTESDLQSFASRTFSFEADGEGWGVVEGNFDRTSTGVGSGGGAPATDTYFASSGFLANQCDHIRSPLLALSPTTTLTLWTNFNIEDDGGIGSWYDRANIGLVDPVSGSRSLIEPSSGRDYDASGANGTCGTTGQRGWAGSQQTWATSTFDPTALSASGIAGDLVQLDLRYGTDGGLHLDGFWFDEATLTDVDVQTQDAQTDVCGPAALIFADGFESGDTSRW